MNKLTCPLLFILTLNFCLAQNENAPIMSMDNAIDRAQRESPSYQKAVTTVANSYWMYRNYRSTLLPSLDLDLTLPNYTAGNDRIQQPDGSFELRKRSVLYNTGFLSIDQNVPFTGGVFSVASTLNRNQVYEPTPNTEWLSVPIIFNYEQPMLLYNNFRWNRKVQPLLYDESLKKYSEDIESIGLETSVFFFEAVTAENAYLLAEINNKNLDTLYRLSKGRYNLGKIAENDLLSIELQLLNSENDLFQAKINRENTYKNLMRFLNYPLDTVLRLALPDHVPDLPILEEKALMEAHENRQQVLEFERRKIQADQRIAEARGQSGYNLSITGQLGISGVGNDIQSAYANPNAQQQYIALNLAIPLVDWGEAKSRVRMAKSTKDLDLVNINQEEINFDQEIRLEVKNYESQRKQLEIAARADTIGQLRYNVTKQRYIIGKINITDLNIAQQEMSNSRLAYLFALRDAWRSYYRIRVLTLYNFETNEKIIFEYEP